MFPKISYSSIKSLYCFSNSKFSVNFFHIRNMLQIPVDIELHNSDFGLQNSKFTPKCPSELTEHVYEQTVLQVTKLYHWESK